MTIERPVLAASLVLGASVATILGAWGFEHIGGLAPCPLCYTQRYFYYAAIPLTALLLLVARSPQRAGLMRGGLVLAGLILLAGAGVGAYHSGIEWKWWEGPQTCAGGAGLSEGGVLPDLGNLTIVRCDEPAWTLFGLSLAGYNVLIALPLALVAFWGANAARNRSPS
jgi:disulfide bond formation protein DsbB